MQHRNKLPILVVLVIVAILVWVRKAEKTPDVASATAPVTVEQAIPVTRTVPRKRTEFVDWGRNPFVFPQRQEEAGSISNLALFCITWNDEEATAFINGSIVHVGDKISDKTVKQIEPNRVILTDGTKDYVLELQQ